MGYKGVLTDSHLLLDDRKNGFVNVKHVIVLYANAMECIHVYQRCLIRTKQFTIIYIILIKWWILSVMHMHGFTILLGYALDPFVCSEHIVYTWVFLNYNKAMLYFWMYSMLFSCARINYSRNLSNINLVYRLLYYPVRIPVLVVKTISLNNWNNRGRVHDTLCKTKL